MEDDYDASEPDTLGAFHKMVLFQTDYDSRRLQGFVTESWNSEVLDSGATSQAWINTYFNSLPGVESISLTTSTALETARKSKQQMPVFLAVTKYALPLTSLPKIYLC